MVARGWISVVSAAVLAAFVGPAVAGAATSPPRAEPALAAIGHAAAIPPGARLGDALPATRVMPLGIALRPRSPGALERFATEVSTPGSAVFGDHVTPAEFAARFGPTRSTVDAVRSTLAADGFSVGTLSANGLLLHVSAPVSTVHQVMSVRLDSVALGGGRTGWMATQAPRLPVRIARGVTAVLGLDQLVSLHPLLEHGKRHSSGAPSRSTATPGGQAAAKPVARGTANACAAARSGAAAYGGWTDNQIAQAYGLDGLYRQGDLGKGETIAIFELEPYLRSDIETFDECYFGADHTDQIRNVAVDGGAGVGSGEGEAVLDIENISALAPAAHLLVYEGPQNDLGDIYGSTDVYDAIVSQDRANIVSTSWGLCEPALNDYAPGTLEVENYLFEEAAAQGQTVFAAAGDDGSDDCSYDSPTPVAPDLSVDDPASQAFVVGAGGTSLLTDSEPPEETVWNDGIAGGGGGGGISTTWRSPAWQALSGVPGVANAYSAKSSYDFCGAPASSPAVPGCREVPDVTLDADEFRGPSVFMASEGDWTTFGGTSSSAPMWAAITAEIASSSACSALRVGDASSQRDPGFVSPALYEVAADPTTDGESFNDITQGSNDIYDLGEGYPATKGYDLASGLGSPIVAGPKGQPGLADSLCALLVAARSTAAASVEVTGVSPSYGAVGGGTTVEITGKGFSAGTPTVDFGSNPAASVTVDSDSEITATSPAAATPSGTIGAPGGPTDITVTVGDRTSQPNPRAVFDYVALSGSSPVPTVRAIGPFGGPLDGGEVVRIYGSGFKTGGPVSSVTFGGVPSSRVQVVSDHLIKARVPRLGPGTACTTGQGFRPANDCQVQVAVTGASGTSAAAPILPAYTGDAVTGANGILEPTKGTEVTPGPTEFDYAPLPSVLKVEPQPVDPSGNTPIVIHGRGFNILTFEWVTFGEPDQYANEDSVIDSIEPDEIVLNPFPFPVRRGSGPVRVRQAVFVDSLGGQSRPRPLTYAGVPVVSALSSHGGADTGGEHVTITGKGLNDVSSVELAATEPGDSWASTTAYDIVSETARSLTFVVPGDLPTVDYVEPCSAAGCTVPKGAAGRAAATYVVYNPGSESISGLSPDSGPAHGGTRVTVYGDNLDGATEVLFGGVPGTKLRAGTSYPDGNPYELMVDAPAGRAGSTVPVVVVTPSGRTGPSRSARYRYRA